MNSPSAPFSNHYRSECLLSRGLGRLWSSFSKPSVKVSNLVLVRSSLSQNHLPNKRHIGKQDPYCVVTVNGEKKRTKSIKRGGQHPEWDEEFRFVLKEAEPEPAPKSKDGTPPPPPPKNTGKLKNIEGGTTMKISCYADDPREPDFIGDCNVDLTEVLTKGECDGKCSATTASSSKFIPYYQSGFP